jgi:hypothetical protein
MKNTMPQNEEETSDLEIFRSAGDVLSDFYSQVSS